METKRPPAIMEKVVEVFGMLTRNSANHGVNADNIGNVLSKIRDGLGFVAETGETSEIAEASRDEAPSAMKSVEKAETIKSPTQTEAGLQATPNTAKSRGRPPKAKLAASEIVAEVEQAPSVDETPKVSRRRPSKVKAAETPTAPAVAVAEVGSEARPKRGRPKKQASDSQSALQLSPPQEEVVMELSDDPKAPNYRFKHLLKNGKAVTFNNMKPEDAIKGETVVCLFDGVEKMMLKKHLRKFYNMSAEEYRRHFGLPEDYPVRGPAFSERKSADAKRTGFGKNKSPEPIKAEPQAATPQTKRGRKPKVKDAVA